MHTHRMSAFLVSLVLPFHLPSAAMKQGFLFEPEAIALTELQDAIARLDFHAAARRLEEFQRVWPTAKLTWEPELVWAGSMLAAKPLDLDSGYQAWQKLEARMNALDISRSWR